MHISLTPELETQIKKKVESGMYNNASEVIREALRFMNKHEELVQYMKLEALRKKLAAGEDEIINGETAEYDMNSIISEARTERNA
ncbi:type II toxin-antitoxin system ParD family antitoxin [Marinifilum sp. JC120]|nr:type II toxin-antitoxin system ParD family antitoxin [Marinifilum sp. JC120]